MDVITRKIKRDRKRRYLLLRKFRKARDLASKHLIKLYPSKYLCRQIRQDELDWIDAHSKNTMAIGIYEWAKKNKES